MTKPRINRTDLTLRNLRATRKRIETLEWDTDEAFERIRRIEEFLSFHGLKTPKRSKRK